MSRSYRHTARRHEDAFESARQRGIVQQAAESAKSAEASPSPLFQFATELTRSHARELVLSRPEPLFSKPDFCSKDAVAEQFAEGRVHRKAPAPVNYHAEG